MKDATLGGGTQLAGLPRCAPTILAAVRMASDFPAEGMELTHMLLVRT